MRAVFQHAIRSSILCRPIYRKVFSKAAPRQLPVRQLSLPIFVVCQGGAVNSLVLTPVHAQVRLTVAVQIHLAQSHTALDWLFVNPRRHAFAVPRHFAGQPGVPSYEPHLPWSFVAAPTLAFP